MAQIDLAPHMLRPTALADIDALHRRYASATPFPHIVIDDFLEPAFADRINDECRETVANQDASNGITQSLKVACTDWTAFGRATHELISYLNSEEFAVRLGEVVGIDGLFGDPELEGGGIHMTRRGGFLKMHTDFNWHKGLQADRRGNILLYLNKAWRTEYNGQLVLSDLDQVETSVVEPVFNRLVIFNTNDKTLHGHPDPLMFPDETPRTSIALYYYSRGEAVEQNLRGRAVTTRYLPRDKGDIKLKGGSIRTGLGYMIRRFLRV